MDGWVGSCQITKIQIHLDMIEIVEFCFMICGDTPSMGRCVGGWMDGWVVGWGHVNWLKIK